MDEVELRDAFDKVVENLRHFTMPMFRSLARSEKLTQQWKAGKGWESFT
jgi:hypothetical protein